MQQATDAVGVMMSGNPVSLALIVVLVALVVIGMALWAVIRLIPNKG